MRFLVPVLLGAILGGLMGRFGGCSGGTCPLMATPWRGAFYGTVIGLLFALAESFR
jgi:hypothetical protein